MNTLRITPTCNVDYCNFPSSKEYDIPGYGKLYLCEKHSQYLPEILNPEGKSEIRSLLSQAKADIDRALQHGYGKKEIIENLRNMIMSMH